MRMKRWLLAGTVLPALVLSNIGQVAAQPGLRIAQAPPSGDDQPGQGQRPRQPGQPRPPGAQPGPQRPVPPAMPQAPRAPQTQPAPGAARPQPPAVPAPQPGGQRPAMPRPAPNLAPAPGQPPVTRPTPPRPPSEAAPPARTAPRAAPVPPPPAQAPAAPAQRQSPAPVPSRPQAPPAAAPRGGPAVPPSAAPSQARPPAAAPQPGVAPSAPTGQPRPPGAAPSAAPGTPAQPGAGAPPAAVPRGGPAVPPSAAPTQRPSGAAPQPGAAPSAPAGQPSPATPPAAAPRAPAAPAQPGAAAPAAPAGPAPLQAPAGAAPAQPGVSPPAPGAGQPPVQPQREGRRGGVSPGVAGAIGLGAGVLGGIMATQGAQRFEDIRSRREERREGDFTVIREPGRTIIRDDDGRAIIRRDEDQRFRDLGWQGRSERRNGETRTVFERPDGTRIVTVTDEEGRLIRRTRIDRNDREVVIIDNTLRDRPGRFADDVVVLPPPPLPIPRERYIVDADQADEALIYETITAPPIAAIPRRYTLDEVRYSPDLRARMRSVDIDTINFDTGSWQVSPDQGRRLAVIADSVRRALQSSPNEVFLVEGHTDAVGSDVDNLSLSDRRAQSVAEILTRDFQIPPENLTTQGYGEQYLKVQTQDAARENRRVTLRRITPLLTGQNR